MLVHFLFAKVGHYASLAIRSSFDGVVDDPVQVAVHSSLVHFHDLIIEALFSGPYDFFSIASSCLFDLPFPPFVFCLLHFLLDFSLFSCSHQFFRELVQSFSDDLSLKSLVHGISELSFMLFEENVFCLLFIEIWNFSYNQQFFDKSQPLVFSFVHYILLGPSSQDSLQKDNRHFPLYRIFRLCRLLLQF